MLFLAVLRSDGEIFFDLSNVTGFHFGGTEHVVLPRAVDDGHGGWIDLPITNVPGSANGPANYEKPHDGENPHRDKCLC